MDFSNELTKNLVGSKKAPSVYEQKVKGKTLQLITQKSGSSSAQKKSKFNVNRAIRRKQNISVPSHETLLKLNSLWKQYASSVTQPAEILKMDLHGALITVERSPDPANVGINGFCLRESQHMLYIVVTDGSLKAIPKMNRVFSLFINDKYVTLFGNQYSFRPADRINRKFKSKNMDLF